MADDATVEGSMLNGVVQGADAVRSIVLTIRSLYEQQEFKFAGPYGDNGFLEDYVAKVKGELYRPFNSLVLFSRVLREKFAGTAIAEHFGASESLQTEGRRLR